MRTGPRGGCIFPFGFIVAVLATLLISAVRAEDRQPGGLLIVNKSTTICYHYRSAKTGQLVTKRYAQRHPNTTVRERCTPLPRPAQR